MYTRAQRVVADCCRTTSTQCHLLTELARTGPLPLSELGTRVSLEKSWVSRAVEAMVERGLVTKEPNPADARSWLVTLTDEGIRTVDELNQHARRPCRATAGFPEHARTRRGRELPAVVDEGPARGHRSELLPATARTKGNQVMLLNKNITLRPAAPADWPAIEALLLANKLPLEGAAGAPRHLPAGRLQRRSRRLRRRRGLRPHRAAALGRGRSRPAPAGHRQAAARSPDPRSATARHRAAVPADRHRAGVLRAVRLQARQRSTRRRRP